MLTQWLKLKQTTRIFDSYFTEQRLIDFMTNIIECVTNISSEKGTNYDIILKRKRSCASRYDQLLRSNHEPLTKK